MAPMGLWSTLRDRGETVGELLRLLRERKRWWLIPLVALMIAVGAVLFLVSQSPVAPFIYTVF